MCSSYSDKGSTSDCHNDKVHLCCTFIFIRRQRTRNEKKASVIIIQCALYHLTGRSPKIDCVNPLSVSQVSLAPTYDSILCILWEETVSVKDAEHKMSDSCYIVFAFHNITTCITVWLFSTISATTRGLGSIDRQTKINNNIAFFSQHEYF